MVQGASAAPTRRCCCRSAPGPSGAGFDGGGTGRKAGVAGDPLSPLKAASPGGRGVPWWEQRRGRVGRGRRHGRAGFSLSGGGRRGGSGDLRTPALHRCWWGGSGTPSSRCWERGRGGFGDPFTPALGGGWGGSGTPSPHRCWGAGVRGPLCSVTGRGNWGPLRPGARGGWWGAGVGVEGWGDRLSRRPRRRRRNRHRRRCRCRVPAGRRAGRRACPAGAPGCRASPRRSDRRRRRTWPRPCRGR